MSGGESLWALTTAELIPLYRSGAADPEQALESVLLRIEQANPRLNAVVTLDLAGARRAAAEAAWRWRAGQPFGPLDGVPLTVKDNLFVQGVRATWGSRLFADFVPDRDDLPVAALRRAGAVIVGKTNTPELALSGYTDNLVFGATGNPWAPELSPGGSSGGAVAAVAAGCAPLALATDAGGSIRRPSGLAGVVGLKPGIGRVPRRFGFAPLAHDLQVIGPVGRSVADVRTVFATIAWPGHPTLAPARRLRIGTFGAFGDAPVDPAVAAAFAAGCAALRAIGHDVEPIAPLWDPDEVGELFGALSSVGVARVMAGIANWRAVVTESIARQAQAGAARSAVQYILDLDRLTAFRWRLSDAMAAWDVIATPASPTVAWPRTDPFPQSIAGRDAGPRATAAFSTAVNLAGLPALVVPAPVPLAGLPVGIQLIGAMESEYALLDLAAQVEAACPWPRLAPM